MIVPSKIIGLQFSMLSPDEIRKNSVVHITSRDTFFANKPVIGGLFDPRMGVLEKGMICPTDGHDYLNCVGYFGHIELAQPVFFPQHIKEAIKICRCVCFNCSQLLIDPNQHQHILDLPASQRCDYVTEIAMKVSRCGEKTSHGCNYKQPEKIDLDDIATITAVWKIKKEKSIMKLSAENIHSILKRIRDDDLHFMGYSPKWSRPEWMICYVLPVPPPSMRPSVKHDAQQRSEDDLTQIYSHIIKTNNDLKAKIDSNAPQNVIEGLTKFLQYFVAMIVDNKTKGAAPLAQRSGRVFTCIKSRINSKNGRIRGNLMGKRVDFSARSVITGDPNLSICELGVPMKIVKNLTKPIMVNRRNHDFLLKLVQNGPNEYPGANRIDKNTGERISLRYVDCNRIQLQDGDIVHRHLMNGDAVLFNRQPSLHRMSIMCHIVRVMTHGDTFRMNVGDTKPYNADFDGDEMNMHVPQNILAETESRHIAAIPYQIVSPSSNSPIIGIYQDSLLGCFRMTRPNITFHPRQAMNLLMGFSQVHPDRLFQYIKDGGNGRITSFQLLTEIMPPLS
jgi:DNA-directed RNA polymerase II subunit RPB1